MTGAQLATPTRKPPIALSGKTFGVWRARVRSNKPWGRAECRVCAWEDCLHGLSSVVVAFINHECTVHIVPSSSSLYRPDARVPLEILYLVDTYRVSTWFLYV